MKKSLFLIAALAFAAIASAQTLFVGTYNIRYKNDGDSIKGNVWSVRSKVIADQINFYEPDIFGTQEVLYTQLEDLKRELDGYDYIGVGRDDGKHAGEYSAIFYDKKRFNLLKNGNFWLSEHPDRPGLGWDAACTRICTWGQFCDKKTGFKFFYFNLHMDHVGVVARREGAKLVISKIKELAGHGAAVILTGDFNVNQKNEIYKIFSNSGILKDTYASAERRFSTNGTWQDFNNQQWSDQRIDHIFVSPKFNVRRYGMVTDSYWTASKLTPEQIEEAKKHMEPGYEPRERRSPSDHYPVFAKIVFKK